ncbi:MAG: transposase, partial [Candidatus Eisenbacteria bacterium]
MRYRRVLALRAHLRVALGERDLAPGAIVCVQTFGSLAHVHPHRHVRVSDGADRRDGRFVAAPVHDAAVREEAWRRAVLKGFVAEDGRDQDAAAARLAWPHSGFGAHLGPRIAAADRAGWLRVARDAALSPGRRVQAARRRGARRGRAGV